MFFDEKMEHKDTKIFCTEPEDIFVSLCLCVQLKITFLSLLRIYRLRPLLAVDTEMPFGLVSCSEQDVSCCSRLVSCCKQNVTREKAREVQKPLLCLEI